MFNIKNDINITLLQTLLKNYNEKYKYKDIAIDNNREVDINDVDSDKDKNSNNIDSDYEKNLFIIFNFSNVE